MTNTNTKIAELAAKNKETHAKRFGVLIDGNLYGIQARANTVAGPKAGMVNAVKKADSVDLIAVPIEQASGFDKISKQLRKVGLAGKDVLPVLEENFEAINVEFEVVDTTTNEAGEEVDVYGLDSVTVDAEFKNIVTVESIKEMDEHARGRVLMSFDKVPMNESVKANAEAMKAKFA